MPGDADALTGAEPAGIPLAPIGARAAVVKEMGVDVDQHVWKMCRAGREVESITYNCKEYGMSGGYRFVMLGAVAVCAA
ncbi:MAG: hypothetical protein ABI637_07645, partial [Gemmatimonadota bacterium]